MKLYLPLAVLLLSGSAALALTSQELADQMTAAGYTRVEVKTGPTQIKVEAIRGTEKLETIYDAATGTVLSREVQLVDAGDDTRPGVQIRDRDEDFTGGGNSSDHGNDDNGSPDHNDDNDDNSSHDNDGDDDHGNGDHGGGNGGGGQGGGKGGGGQGGGDNGNGGHDGDDD
ncbi:MAG: PepSY domain-containing protein [Pseudomonadota bacterium]